MTKNLKRYFSFFGILIATVSLKMDSLLNSLKYLINVNIPKIMKILHISQLKPIKLYSTNKTENHRGNLNAK